MLTKFVGCVTPLGRRRDELSGLAGVEVVVRHRARFNEFIAEVEGLIVPDECLSCNDKVALSQDTCLVLSLSL